VNVRVKEVPRELSLPAAILRLSGRTYSVAAGIDNSRMSCYTFWGRNYKEEINTGRLRPQKVQLIQELTFLSLSFQATEFNSFLAVSVVAWKQ
jgi:hypothetical protein